MTERMTPKAELADVLLAAYGGVKWFVVTRRMRVQPMPWEGIAADIEVATGGRVSVTAKSVQTWMSDEDFAPPAAGPAVAS